MTKISIVGTGYVGLVSGVCLAEKGHEVICVDSDQTKVASIADGIMPIYEYGLQELVIRNLGKSFSITTDLEYAIKNTEITLIAVGTPFDGESIDLSAIRSVSKEIGHALRKKSSYHLVAVKSTVVPGTTFEVVKPILEESSGKLCGRDFGLGMNPEFLREGEAVKDFMFPDRIILGVFDKKSRDYFLEVYGVFEDITKVIVDITTAEMIKYTSNALLASLISFSNEIANLCATINTDVVDVMEALHLDRRLMPILTDGTRVRPGVIDYLSAGCGFGGSCFPKDVQALISFGAKHGEELNLLRSVISINSAQPLKMIEMLEKHLGDICGIRVGVLGLAFKPGTDDIRESPSIKVCDALLNKGAIVFAYDPIAGPEAQKIFDNKIHLCDDLSDLVETVDALLLMTAWEDFRILPSLMKEKGVNPLMVDGRRMFRKSEFLNYKGIGI